MKFFSLVLIVITFMQVGFAQSTVTSPVTNPPNTAQHGPTLVQPLTGSQVAKEIVPSQNAGVVRIFSQGTESEPIFVHALPGEGINVNVSRNWIDNLTLWFLGLGFLVQVGTLCVVWTYTEATKELLEQAQNQTATAQEQNGHAQKQNAYAQEQIELTQRKMKADEDLRVRAAMPLFVWKLDNTPHVRGAIEDIVNLEFHNRGGSFVVLECRHIGLTEVRLNFSYLESGEAGRIGLFGWPDQLIKNSRKVVYFGLQILTSIGERRDLVFRMETSGAYPEMENGIPYKSLDNSKKTVGVSELS